MPDNDWRGALSSTCQTLRSARLIVPTNVDGSPVYISEWPVAVERKVASTRPPACRQRFQLASTMLAILVQHLPRDRERMGLRPVQMAGRLGLTLTEYRALEAGELHIDYDLYLRITDLCGWPR